MEAKDTVLPYLKVSNQIPMSLLEFIAKLEEQAEISFKAGRRAKEEESEARLELIRRLTAKLEEVPKQLEAHGDICYKTGIREVVEWNRHNVKQYFDTEAWVAKLKEWGIE